VETHGLSKIGMPSLQRFFTHYWTNTTADRARDESGELLDYAAGNVFRTRGVKPGDRVYVVTVRDARLFLIARMKVAKVCSIGQAADALDCEGV
jgi:hypothetical protein